MQMCNGYYIGIIPFIGPWVYFIDLHFWAGDVIAPNYPSSSSVVPGQTSRQPNWYTLFFLRLPLLKSAQFPSTVPYSNPHSFQTPSSAQIRTVSSHRPLLKSAQFPNFPAAPGFGSKLFRTNQNLGRRTNYNFNSFKKIIAVSLSWLSVLSWSCWQYN